MGWVELMMKGDIDRLREILKRSVVIIVVLILRPSRLELFDFRTTLITLERTFPHGSTTLCAF